MIEAQLHKYIFPDQDMYALPDTRGEVTVVRSMARVNAILYLPNTAEGREALAMRVAEVHAAAVFRRLNALNCPTSQKLKLLDAVIDTAKNSSREWD